jgi:hypothetical protein
MKNDRINLLMVSFLTLLFSNLSAQTASRNGHDLPVRGTVRVLFVFAEINGSCAGTAVPGWSSGTNAPPNANDLIDDVVSPTPISTITKYYKEMSLGEYNIIGDYYDGTVQVDCQDLVAGNQRQNSEQALNVLNSVWTAAPDGKYYTKNGHPLDDFDMYTPNTAYGPHSGVPDGYIDAVVVLWRNHPVSSCGAGLGVGNKFTSTFPPSLGPTVGNKKANTFGTWEFCPNNVVGSSGMFFAEYIHVMHGGNHFHSGGGASSGTFMFNEIGSFGMTSQAGGASKVVSGWDRWFLDWKNGKNYSIGALDPVNGTEVLSDLRITYRPNATEFVLRDFITEGDAVRIKLPHFDWTSSGDKKNQYLWIENHQLVSDFDINKFAGSGCASWQPGLFCYIQVGKDVITGGGVDNSAYSAPNGLKDWIFPLSAEGRWDQYYDIGKRGVYTENCAWGNKSTPFSRFFPPDGTTKPNPLTGYQDAWGKIDTDGDGYLYDDPYPPHFHKWNSTPTSTVPSATANYFGDEFDSFQSTGQALSLGSNPAPLPVYTLRQQQLNPASYDNRSVHLNNLKIEVLDNNVFGVAAGQPRAFKIRVSWDEPEINNDVRWCGNIVLKNDAEDPQSRPMEIVLCSSSVMTLDKGLSPTQIQETSPGSGDFTEPTFLHLLNGSRMLIRSGSRVNVINGSTLHVKSGATLELEASTEIYVDATSSLCIEEGANVILHNAVTSVINVNGVITTGTLHYSDWVMSSKHAYTDIEVSGSPGIGSSMPSSPQDVSLTASKLVLLEAKTHIQVQGSQSFLARIYSPEACYIANSNYNLRLGGGSGNNDGEKDENTCFMAPTKGGESIGNTLNNSKLHVYPNPSSGVFNLTLSSATVAEIVLYDYLGKQLEVRKSDGKTTQLRLDLSQYSGNVFLLQVKQDGTSTSEKLIKR